MPDEPGRLPAVPGDAEVAEVVIDGRIVEPRRLIPAPVRVVAGHPHARLAGRHLGYVIAGAVVAVRRRHARKVRHEQVMRALQAAGNHDAMLAWRQQQEAEQKGRAERRRAWVQVTIDLLKASPVIGAVALVVMIGFGLLTAISMNSLYGFAVPWLDAAHALAAVRSAASAVWSVATFAVPAGAVLWLHHLGRTDSMAPGWVATSADPDIDASIDEVTITGALGNMRIPQIRDHIKDGLPLQFIVPCRQEGRGTYCEVRLPGVPAEKIARRRPDLAAGVHRMAKEVFPSVGSEAAILKLWIADKGALEEGAGPYPLLEEGFADVFKGLPFGRTLRGDPIRIPVIGRNSICGGMPEQGKSNAARVTAAGYALDVDTELRIWVPDTNFDFEAFAPRCSQYVMGAEDEHIEAILGHLEELKDELQRRGQLLIDYEQQEVTPELARAGVGLHPMYCLLEEAHVAIQHHKHGKAIGGLLGDIVRLDRKRGIHVKVSTQAPTKDSMPRDVTRNCTVGIAFAVGDHVANDALLGQGAYRAGHRATELIPFTDRGTALCKGFSGERSEMVQVHRLRTADVAPIVSRALAEMARRGRELPGSGLPMIESRDLLADLAEVTRGDSGRVNLAELPGRLRKLAPSWGAYKGLTGTALRPLLEVEGVRVYTTGGTLRVDAADLAAAATRPTGATPAGQGPVGELED